MVFSELLVTIIAASKSIESSQAYQEFSEIVAAFHVLCGLHDAARSMVQFATSHV